MQSNSRIAVRYAKALLDLAKEQKVINDVYADMKLVINAIENNSELASLLNNPTISQSKKQSIFKAVFDAKIQPISSKFLQLVINKRREADLHPITTSFVDLYNEENNITRVVLTTAVAIDAKLEQSIIKKIKESASLKTIELEKVVDQSILGGYVVEFNNRILDHSIQSNLNSIKRRFSAN